MKAAFSLVGMLVCSLVVTSASVTMDEMCDLKNHTKSQAISRQETVVEYEDTCQELYYHVVDLVNSDGDWDYGHATSHDWNDSVHTSNPFNWICDQLSFFEYDAYNADAEDYSCQIEESAGDYDFSTIEDYHYDKAYHHYDHCLIDSTFGLIASQYEHCLGMKTHMHNIINDMKADHQSKFGTNIWQCACSNYGNHWPADHR